MKNTELLFNQEPIQIDDFTTTFLNVANAYHKVCKQIAKKYSNIVNKVLSELVSIQEFADDSYDEDEQYTLSSYSSFEEFAIDVKNVASIIQYTEVFNNLTIDDELYSQNEDTGQTQICVCDDYEIDNLGHGQLVNKLGIENELRIINDACDTYNSWISSNC